jgi:hypothetical protein
MVLRYVDFLWNFLKKSVTHLNKIYETVTGIYGKVHLWHHVK